MRASFIRTAWTAKSWQKTEKALNYEVRKWGWRKWKELDRGLSNGGEGRKCWQCKDQVWSFRMIVSLKWGLYSGCVVVTRKPGAAKKSFRKWFWVSHGWTLLNTTRTTSYDNVEQQSKLRRKTGGETGGRKQGGKLGNVSIWLKRTDYSVVWGLWCGIVINEKRSSVVEELQKTAISSSEWSVPKVHGSFAVTVLSADSGGALIGAVSEEGKYYGFTGDGAAAEYGCTIWNN